VSVQRLVAPIVSVDIVRVVEKLKRSQNLPELKRMSSSTGVVVVVPSPKAKGRTLKKTTFDCTPELFAIDENSDDERNGGVEYIAGDDDEDGDGAHQGAADEDVKEHVPAGTKRGSLVSQSRLATALAVDRTMAENDVTEHALARPARSRQSRRVITITAPKMLNQARSNMADIESDSDDHAGMCVCVCVCVYVYVFVTV